MPQTNPQPDTPNQKIDIIHHYKVTALLVLSLSVGVYISLFGIYRIWGGRTIVGGAELGLGIFFLLSYQVLRKRKEYYPLLAKIFFLFGYLLMVILTLYIPEERTHILWVPAILVFIFFLLDYKGGLLYLVAYIAFVLYLAVAGYDYTPTEYITWIFSLIATSVVMYYYEKIKRIEQDTLKRYSEKLEKEVAQKTIALFEKNRKLETLNNSLECRIEEALARQAKQEQALLQQCRLGSMGEVLDSIAHQWRQPLMHINAVLLNLDRELESQGGITSSLEEKITEITTLTTGMSRTIEALRLLFTGDKQKSDFDLNESIDKALAFYRPALSEIEVIRHTSPNIRYYGFPNEITQAILLLVGNAIEAIHTDPSLPKRLRITLMQNTDTIDLHIEECTGGISPEMLSRIFEPYSAHRTEDTHTGLGLYIAKIIIEENAKGKLSVQSLQQGTRFSITLRRGR